MDTTARRSDRRVRENERGDRGPHRSYVLIACAPYSGSTLLASLLGAHPQIATVSEVSGTRRAGQMDAFRCSCQRLMIECPFWQEIQDRARSAGIADLALGDFGLRFGKPGLMHRLRTGSLRWTLAEAMRDAALHLAPSYERSLRVIGERNRIFANVVLDVTGKTVFVDTSKEGMRLRYLRRYLDMDLRAVHLIRDVRGVVSSAKQRHGAHVDVAVAATAWTRTNRTLMRHLQAMDPATRMLVRYEDLCRDPGRTMAALYDFCGVDPSAGPAPSVSHQSQHLLGNRARLQPTTEIRLDERWRTSLSSDELATIVRLSAPLVQSLTDAADERG